jgi:hypothetical protein
LPSKKASLFGQENKTFWTTKRLAGQQNVVVQLCPQRSCPARKKEDFLDSKKTGQTANKNWLDSKRAFLDSKMLLSNFALKDPVLPGKQAFLDSKKPGRTAKKTGWTAKCCCPILPSTILSCPEGKHFWTGKNDFLDSKKTGRTAKKTGQTANEPFFLPKKIGH